ncbi:MAG TPA: hypothetical protein VH353_14375 [Caulobacteraceae bacterium]|jgi:hypothetical protein|nr:hypothetical protein [Caulobacteraceae bacterium]
MFYVSEVYGVAANAYMQREYHGLSADHRHKLEACRLLMSETAERLREQLVKELGLEVKPPTRAEEMAPLIAALPHGSWHQRMLALEDLSVRGVEAYRKLRGIYGDAEPHLCASLIAKEIAMRDFARDELDGETETSAERVVTLLSPDSQTSLAGFDADAPPPQTARGG